MLDVFRQQLCDNRQIMNIGGRVNKRDKTRTFPIRLGILTLPAFNSMAMHAFLDPLRAANYLRGETVYQWQFIALDHGPVTASNGIVIENTIPFNAISLNIDIVVINASWTPERFQIKTLNKWLRRLSYQGTTLIGLDTGAFIMAFAGLLDGYRATVHFEHIPSFAELFPQSNIEETLYVIDGERASCCGGMAGADLALELIRQAFGHDLANGAARYLFHDRLRRGEEHQRVKPLEPVGLKLPRLIHQSIALMEKSIEDPLKVHQIAEEMGISQRQLERLFRLHTGLSPIRYYLNIRLEQARSLLTQTNYSIMQVASACGFKSAEHFTRSYKALFNISPSIDRKEGRIPFQLRSRSGYIEN